MRTYGSIRREAGSWFIRCEPHVRLRLKGNFRQIKKSDHDEVVLSDTPAHAHELLWFLQRFPMVLPPAEAQHLAARDEQYLHRQELISGILDGSSAPRDFELAVPAREYQKIAAEVVLRSGALLLADDVGLGKTASAICALTDARTRPALVVTLTHLPPQWVSELEKFAPDLRVRILRSGKPYDLTRWRGKAVPFPDVVIVNYAKLSGWADTLAPLIRMVIFDECQELRRGDSNKYEGACHLARSANFRMGLSATPIYNYGGEIFSVLDCLAPDLLGTRYEFGREWCVGGQWSDQAQIEDPKVFGHYAREEGLMLRRTRAEVGRELPPVSRIPHQVDAELHPLEQVQTSATELARIILAQGESHRGQKLHAAQELSYKLREATGIAKALHVAAFVRLLIETGEKVVLYGWHHAVYDLWRAAFADLDPSFYTGHESVAQKVEARRRFLEDETPLLIMSLRSGAGLDGLQQVSKTVVFGELDWSPGVHEQCLGRVARDGQAHPVVGYFLIADVGSDPVVADVLGLKRRQAEGIVDPDADLIEDLQIDPGHVRKLAEVYLAQRERAERAAARVLTPFAREEAVG